MKKLIACLMFSITCFSAEQNYFAWGSSARLGNRGRMEDRTISLFPLNEDKSRGIFGIFDGHGNQHTAEYVARNFESYYLQHNTNGIPNYGELFEELNNGIYSEDKCFNAGTCALVGYLHKYYYNLAWVGDSRAVLMSEGQQVFETVDHKLRNKREYSRLKGNIYTDNWGAERCCQLVISRALGNEVLSEQYSSYKSLILSKPDVCQGTAKPGDMLILACDGIWDVFKSEEACEFVHAMLNLPKEELESKYSANPLSKKTNLHDPIIEENGDEYLKLIARALRDEAYNKGSGDNLSVQVIQFK